MVVQTFICKQERIIIYGSDKTLRCDKIAVNFAKLEWLLRRRIKLYNMIALAQRLGCTHALYLALRYQLLVRSICAQKHRLSPRGAVIVVIWLIVMLLGQ